MAEWSKALHPAAAGRAANEVGIKMKGFVYILKSASGKYYTGSTIDIVERLKRHNAGTGAQTTKNAIWELVCYREFDTLNEARTEEKRVKSFKGGNGFKKIINGELAEWSKAPHC